MPQQDMMDEEQVRAQNSLNNCKILSTASPMKKITEAFLEESENVISRINELRQILIRAPELAEFLSDLRRQFHTPQGVWSHLSSWGVAEFARRVELRFNEALSKSKITEEVLIIWLSTR